MGYFMVLKRVALITSLILVALLANLGCVKPTDPPVPPVPPVTPRDPVPPVTTPITENGLEPISIMPRITGRWELNDGTVLLEGTMASGYRVYSRYYPAYDKVQTVMWDSAGAQVKDIKDGQIVFICTQSAPNAVWVFPYLLDYDLTQSAATVMTKVFLPLSAGVEFGNLTGQITPMTADRISPESDSVSLGWLSMSEVVPPIKVSPLVEEKKILIRLKGVSASSNLRLPLTINGGDGLIRSVVVEDGVSGTADARTKDLIVSIAVAEDKWDAATYDCVLDAGDNGSVRLNLYIDKTPTDLTPSVKR